MSVLVDHEIVKAVQTGYIYIDHFNPAHVCPNSYDITLLNSFGTQSGSGTIDPRWEKNSVELKECDEIEVAPGEHMLGCSTEYFRIPNDIVAFLHGRSSWARLGLQIHCAGLLDSGWEGQITLEIMNFNKRPILLRAGDRIGQVTFHRCTPCEVPYSLKKKSKYNQQTGATGSRIYGDWSPI